MDAALVRRRWGEVLDTLGRIRRTSWVLVARSATVGEIRDGVMHLIFETDGLQSAFRSGRHDENVALALDQTLGVKVRVVGITGPPGEVAGPAAAAPGATSETPMRSDVVPPPPEEDAPSPDDADAEDSGLMGIPVIERLLGGRVLDEETR